MSSVPDAAASGTPSRSSAVADARQWQVLIGRAIPALVLGLALTFFNDHSAAVGLIGFGLCAVAIGIVLVTLGRTAEAAGRVRSLIVAQAAVWIVGGAASLASAGAGPLALTLAVGLTALVAGALELAVGILTRGSSPVSRDRIIGGAVTLLLAVVVLAVPSGFTQSFEGENGISGMLTGSIVIVGAIGAWGVIVGVFYLIAAISLRGRGAVRS